MNHKVLRNRLLGVYLIGDALAAAGAYTLLYYVRKTVVESAVFGVDVQLIFGKAYYTGVFAIVIAYLSISVLSAAYKDLLRKGRLNQIVRTLGQVFGLSILLFFGVMLDDIVRDYRDYYLTFGVFFGSLLTFSLLVRISCSTYVHRLIQHGKLAYATLLIGGGESAQRLYNNMTNARRKKGYHFIGYTTDLQERTLPIPYLGGISNVADLIHDNYVEDVIVAFPQEKQAQVESILNDLDGLGCRVHIVPGLYNILSGQVKMESIGQALIEVKHELIKPHTAVFKRLFDITTALTLLLLTSPVLLFSIIMVKLGSKGPIFYLQERIGEGGNPFNIIKLRSMVVDAEKLGPQLSSEDDPRITKWGKTMRKFRFDELPQFINVLLGHMSIVGPRPERRYFIEQITSKAPQYKHLLRVRPGITSWGMVKFGYAENVEEMIERSRFDLIYIENISILNDIKILFYTLVIVLQGRGK